MLLTHRSVVTFLFVFFSAGLLFYVLGVAENGSDLMLSIAGRAPIPFWLLCFASAFIGTLSGFAFGEQTRLSGVLYLFGAPLFFVLGFGEVRPLLLVLSVYAFHAFMFLLVLLSVGLMQKREYEAEQHDTISGI